MTGSDPDGVGPLGAPLTTYSYEANGNLLSTTDPNENATPTSGDGVTARIYDRANRLTGIDYSDSTPDVTFTFDAAGNRTGMTDGAGSVSYSYDNLNRPTGVTRGADAFSSAYDAASNVTSRTYPGGIATTYTYDNDNRMASATSAGATTSYAYDTAGRVTQTTLPLSNGYVESRGYDRAGRLASISNVKSGTTLSAFGVTLDPVGNPTTIVRSGTVSLTSTFDYDANDRLAGVCFQSACLGGTDPFIRWTYDRVGNRLTEARPGATTSYAYDALDELTQAGSTSFSYDANGNQLAGGPSVYTYDLANRLASTTDAARAFAYSYDGDGNRLQAIEGSTSTRYLWDTNAGGGLPQLALERDGAGSLLRSYIYGGRRISIEAGATGAHFYTYDALGSVANLTSSSGGPEWTYGYEPFGSPRAVTKDDPAAPENPMRFAGEQLDPTGLTYLRARQYDAASGRFLAVDPVVRSIGAPAMSGYVYADNRPTVFVDPTGMTAMPSSAGTTAASYATSGVSVFSLPVSDGYGVSARFVPSGMGGPPNENKGVPRTQNPVGDMIKGATKAGRAAAAMDSFARGIGQFEGRLVSTSERIIAREAKAAGWTEARTRSGKMWVDPAETVQIRLSYEHAEPRLYSSWRNRGRGPDLRGTATLKKG